MDFGLYNMSFSELKQELHKSIEGNDNIKEHIIRKLMEEKYREYIIKKNRNNQKKKMLKMKSKENNKIIDSLFVDDGQVDNDDDNNMQKFTSEMEKDFVNNSLMDRLNGEIELLNKKTTKKTKGVVPPFDNSSNIISNYASLDTLGMKKKTFDTRKLVNAMHEKN